MKKHTKKNASKIGKNVFGETCIVKEIELQKETVFEQYMQIIEDIEAHSDRGPLLEYTVTYAKDMEQNEIEELNAAVPKIMALRASFRGTEFCKASFHKAV